MEQVLIKKPTAKTAILNRLEQGGWFAVHELQLIGYSENSLASRLPELAISGQVVSRIRAGKPYKEWALKSKEVA